MEVGNCECVENKIIAEEKFIKIRGQDVRRRNKLNLEPTKIHTGAVLERIDNELEDKIMEKYKGETEKNVKEPHAAKMKVCG